MSHPKILIGYSWFASDAYGDLRQMHRAYVERLNQAGYDVEDFCLTLNPPGPRLSFEELDQRWKSGDRMLLQMYEDLERALENKDVLINGSGINLHPAFVEKLRVFTVFQCFDDIEGLNPHLTVPAAHAYELCLTGNVAEVESYRAFGIQNVEWTPMGLLPDTYDPKLTYEEILSGERDIDVFMMIDRLSPYGNRIERLNDLSMAFPNAHFYGNGWPRGYLPPSEELKMMRRSKIGPNIHLGSGPLNYRTYYLPANGVLQVCDNKSHLGKIFALDKEVVGFNNTEEAIDLIRYYLAHDQQRREIAAAGWRRAISDYNEVAVFSKKLEIIEHYRNKPREKARESGIALRQRRRTRKRRAEDAALRWMRRYVPKEIRSVLRWARNLNSASQIEKPRSSA